MIKPEHRFQVAEANRRLVEANGGYEVVHESPGLEVGVYVLVAPEPDRQQPHEEDEVYVVLEGTGTLDVEGTEVDAPRRRGGIRRRARRAPVHVVRAAQPPGGLRAREQAVANT